MHQAEFRQWHTREWQSLNLGRHKDWDVDMRCADSLWGQRPAGCAKTCWHINHSNPSMEGKSSYLPEPANAPSCALQTLLTLFSWEAKQSRQLRYIFANWGSVKKSLQGNTLVNRAIHHLGRSARQIYLAAQTPHSCDCCTFMLLKSIYSSH